MGAFVGRERELRILEERLADAARGHGQLVLISGEPGIGKTRLTERFTDRAHTGGVLVGWGRASEDEGSPPYWIFRQVLRSLDVAMPELRPGAAPQQSAEARFEFFETMAEQLRTTAAGDGLIVVLDDLQWADGASLALLVHLARGLSRSRLMIVGTYRDTEATGRPALANALAALAHESGLTRVRLVGLTDGGVAQQLADLAGGEVPSELVRRVSRRTGGNPFFIAELSRLGERDPDALPDAVLDAVRARLAKLSSSCRELVASAANLGSELDALGLAEVTERPIADVLVSLDEATEAGMLDASEGWRFRHDLIRESARRELPTAERLAGHARMADWLERRPEAADASAIAFHRLAALPLGDATAAAKWAERAGDEAVDQLAWERAAALYRRALETGAPIAAADRARLLRLTSLAHVRAGDAAAAADALSDAVAAARESGDPEALGEVALVTEGMSDAWDFFRGAPVAAEALAALPPTDHPLRARLLALHAAENGLFGATDAEQNSVAALAMAHRLGDSRVLRSALRARQMVRSGPDGVHERLELGDQMLAIGRREGDDDAELWGRLWRFDALAMLGRLDHAEAELGPIQALADRLRRPIARWHYLRTKAAIDMARGRFEEARRATQEEAGLVTGREQNPLRGVPAAVLVVIASLTGRRDAALESTFDLFHRMAPPFTLSMLGLYHLRLGDRDAAERAFQSAGPVSDIPLPALLSVACTRVELAAGLGHTGEALEAAAILRPHSQLFATGGAGALLIAGSVRTYLGLAAGAAGRLDDAARDIRAGLVINERAGTAPFTALAQVELARVLARRRRPGDRDEAAALAASAAAVARRLGMAPLVGAAETLVRELSDESPGPLTRREREVADQVAKGLTNKQIAALLHISERTAESHVQHVLTKLGAANRTQVAAYLATKQMRTGGP